MSVSDQSMMDGYSSAEDQRLRSRFMLDRQPVPPSVPASIDGRSQGMDYPPQQMYPPSLESYPPSSEASPPAPVYRNPAPSAPVSSTRGPSTAPGLKRIKIPKVTPLHTPTKRSPSVQTRHGGQQRARQSAHFQEYVEYIDSDSEQTSSELSTTTQATTVDSNSTVGQSDDDSVGYVPRQENSKPARSRPVLRKPMSRVATAPPPAVIRQARGLVRKQSQSSISVQKGNKTLHIEVMPTQEEKQREEELLEEIDALKRDVVTLQSKENKSIRAIEDATEKFSVLQAESGRSIEDSQKTISILSTERDAIEKEKEDLRADFIKQGRLLEEIREALDHTKQELLQTVKERDDLQEREKSLEGKCQDLEKELDNKEMKEKFLVDQVASMRISLDVTDSRTEALVAEVATITTERDQLREQTEQRQKEIEELSNRVQEAKDEGKDAVEKVEQLEKDKSELEAAKVGLEAEKAAAEAKIDEINGELDKAKAAAAEATAETEKGLEQISKLEAEHKDLTEKQEADAAASAAKISDLEGQLETLAAEKAALEAQIADLVSGKAELEAKLETMTADHNTQQTRATELTDELATASSNHEAVAAELASLKADHDALQASSAALAADKVALEADTARLSARVADLESIHVLDAVRAERDGLEAVKAELEATAAALAADKSGLEAQVASLSATADQLPGLRREKDALAERVVKLVRQVEKARAAEKSASAQASGLQAQVAEFEGRLARSRSRRNARLKPDELVVVRSKDDKGVYQVMKRGTLYRSRSPSRHNSD